MFCMKKKNEDFAIRFLHIIYELAVDTLVTGT